MLHSSKIFIDACLSGNRTFSARPIAKFGALTEFSRKFHHQQHNSFLLAENFPQQDSFNPASYHEFYANSWLENDGLSVLPLWNVEQQNGVAEKQQIMSTNLLQSQSELIELQTPRELNAMIHDHVRKIYEGPRVEFQKGVGHDVSAGFLESVIPLRSRADCQKMYVSDRDGGVRLGKILYDLDCLATIVAYKHNQDPAVQMGTPAHHTIGIVTARVERIDLHPKMEFTSDEDIFFTGFVSWVGNSSMEVTLRAEQYQQTLLEAKFIMVTVSADGKGKAPNVPLRLRTETDRALFNQGEVAKQNRIKRDALEKKLPNIEAIKAQADHSFAPSAADSPSSSVCSPAETKLENSLWCWPEFVNVHGKVSGEWLLSEAHDLALANVSHTFRTNAKCVGLTNGLFLKPVRLNSLVRFTSKVCYTDERYAVAVVKAEEERQAEGGSDKVQLSTTTNSFNLIFDLGAKNDAITIFPRTHDECRMWANARCELEFFHAQKMFRTEEIEPKRAISL